jgi:ERCC4-type nuclease
MTPEEMEKAIIRNLPEKTGKSLEEWFAVLSASGLSEKRELKEHLKKVHGVGHFQAQTIVKFYPQK